MGSLPFWVVLLSGLVLAAALVFALWCSWTAGRLDRLHLRLELAQASLEALLQHRASVAMELAVGGLGDPASDLLLLEVAREAREGEADGPERWQSESDLTAVLMAVELPPAAQEPLVDELAGTARKVGMARRIHNDVAATTRHLHQRRRVRWFRLAGHAPWPGMVDFDDRSDFGRSSTTAPTRPLGPLGPGPPAEGSDG